MKALLKKKKSVVVIFGTVIALFLIVLLLTETGIASRQMQSLLVPICINIILAVSLNVTVGFLGELTLGHAGFMSVGAYAGCLFSIATADALPTLIRFPLAMLIGGIVAAIFGIIIGVPVLRLRGDYLAIVTLAFGEIIRSVIINLGFTGGASGLKGTPQDSTYVICFVVILIMLYLITNFIDSKHGRAIKAIRDNYIATESVGINLTYYKLLAFVIAAFFAGVAGVLYGHNLNILNASTFDYNKSIEILVMVVMGGMGSILGSIISAIIITLLPEVLRGLDDYRMLIYSLVLIVMMIINSSPALAPLKEKLSWKYLFNKIRSRKEKTEKEEV